ncbi:MAG: hypothetical protein HY288_05645 [Planctomycetia bacterium]|nr:hypothetical protein [Planctomycetia bacterium]
MQRANYFHDGYTQRGFIGAVPLMHGSLRFTYRPALVEERSQLSDAAATLKSRLYDRQVAMFTAQKIVLWDLTDVEGREVAVSADALLRLQPGLFVKLHRIVLGWIPSDIDPTWPAETMDRMLDDETESVFSGKTVGELREENDEKN